MRIESKDLVVWGFPATDDAALVALRVTVGASRGVMRRSDERVMVIVNAVVQP